MAKSDVLVRMKADTSGYDANIAKARRQLDQFKKDNLSAGGAIKQLSSSLVTTAAKFVSFGAVAAGAAKVVKDAFFQSESNIDEWGRTVKSAEGIYDTFLNTINSGNWSNFFTNLSTAVQGARDLYDALDRLGSVKSNNQAAVAILQQQIAQLRLMKQQGQNVDEQLKVATERLRQLQNQSVDAGKAAGHATILNTLRNRVNAGNTTGVNISEGTLRGVAGAIETRGQSAFDQYKRQYEALTSKGLETVSKYDSLTKTYYNAQVFNLEKLSKEEQKRYLIAKAVTEGETEIQKGIGIYAQAVSEGTAAAREEFKGNRYALQGAGGSGSGKGGGKVKDKIVTGSLADLMNDLKYLQQEQTKATNTKEWETYQDAIIATQMQIKELKGELKTVPTSITELAKTQAGADIKAGKDSLNDRDRVSKGMASVVARMQKEDKKEKKSIAEGLGQLGSGLGGIQSGFQQLGLDLGDGFNSVVSGLQGISTILMAIQTIITAIEAISAADAIIPLARGGVVHAAGGFMVPGNNYSGDLVPAYLNSGEMVLNKFQQQALAGTLEGGGSMNVNVNGAVSGENIVLVADRYGKRTGRGELAFTHKVNH